MIKFRRTPLAQAVSAALLGPMAATSLCTPAKAADEGPSSNVIEEIIVTAAKREQKLQDVPMSIQVLDTKKLDELFIHSYVDYVNYLPTVSFKKGDTPGWQQIYMRGVNSGDSGHHSGSMPSVGVYLDEQPITTIGQVLDVNIYDIARIETLPGPQGTLYGQGSQSGTLRIISNQPKYGVSEYAYDVRAESTSGGEPSFGIQGFVNVPISDNAAIRLVGWHKEEGGYIDNVRGDHTFAASGIMIDNADAVEEDYNDVDTTGGRALLKVDLNDSWTAKVGIMGQKYEATGGGDQTPALGDLKTLKWISPREDEDWYQASLTLDGNIGDINLVYATAYLDRNSTMFKDYMGYSMWLEEYAASLGQDCWYYDSLGECGDPSQHIDMDMNNNRGSNELRLQSTGDGRFNWIAGWFYQRQQQDYDLRWVTPGAESAIYNVMPDQDVTVTWSSNQIRTDRDSALFGEVSFDFTDKLTGTAGVRFFEYDNILYGFNGQVYHCTGFTDENGYFTHDPINGTLQDPCFDTRDIDGATKGDGESYKANLTYHVNDTKMIYGTYSEGFRAGGVNRARVEGIPPYGPDYVYNYEFGWKTTWKDGRVVFNGAAYYLEWDDVQFSFLDFEVSPVTIIQNVGNAETTGIEFDLLWSATDDLNLKLSGAYTRAELKESFWRIDADEAAGEPPTVPAGTEMPNVPKIQFTATGRYNFELGRLPSYVQLGVIYNDETWNTLPVANREVIDSYTLVDAAIGFHAGNWTIDVFGKNLTDERAMLDRWTYWANGDKINIPNRPRSFGIRIGQRFQ